jgi:hypothetical protein
MLLCEAYGSGAADYLGVAVVHIEIEGLTKGMLATGFDVEV